MYLRTKLGQNGSKEDFGIFNSVLDFLINHSHYNFLKFDCFIFHQLLCRVVIGQCNRIGGCNRTPVIGQLHQPIISALS